MVTGVEMPFNYNYNNLVFKEKDVNSNRQV